MSASRNLLLLLLAAMLLVACSSSSEGVSANVNQNNLCSEMAKVLCHNLHQCCTNDQISQTLGVDYPTSEDQCRNDMQLSCEKGAADILYGLQEGTVELEAAGVTACLQSLIAPAGQCFPTYAEPEFVALCNVDVATGLQGAGKACVHDIECKTDHYCAADRKCKSLPGKGDDCEPQAPQECASGLYCDENLLCKSLNAKNDECDGLNPCKGGLYCGETDPGDPFECKALRDIGNDCIGHWQCNSQYCIPGLCNDGQECFADEDCQGKCEGSANVCFDDVDCGGICSVSGGACSSDFDCVLNDDECEHAKCQRKCMGEPVCGELYGVIDYCELSEGLLQFVNP